MRETRRPENVLNYLQLDRIELEIGYGLIPLVDAEQDGDLLEEDYTYPQADGYGTGLSDPAGQDPG